MKIDLPHHCVIEINNNNIENLKQIQLILHENGYYWISGVSLLLIYYTETKFLHLIGKSVTWSSNQIATTEPVCRINYKTLLNFKNLYED